jgi:hypothetical protein
MIDRVHLTADAEDRIQRTWLPGRGSGPQDGAGIADDPVRIPVAQISFL